MTSDAAGQLYVLWNSGTVDGGPERIYFSTSTDQGNTWSPKADVSLAPSGVDHAFPSVAAGAAGGTPTAPLGSRHETHREQQYCFAIHVSASSSGRTTPLALCTTCDSPF